MNTQSLAPLETQNLFTVFMQTLKVRLQLSENFDFTQTTLTLLKQEDMILNRGSHQRRSIKKSVLRNFAIFT